MCASVLIVTGLIAAQTAPARFAGDSDARPPVTKSDVKIVQRARQILNSPSKWNRADTRICPADAKTFSLYCALEKAPAEVSGGFKLLEYRISKRLSSPDAAS